MYTGKLSPEVYFERVNLDSAREQVAFIRAYILAERFDDKELRTHIVESMISKSVAWDKIPGAKMCQWVWKGTMKGCPLRTFLLGWQVARGNNLSFAEEGAKYPKEYLEEIVFLLMDPTTRTRPTEDDREFADRIRSQLFPGDAKEGTRKTA